MARKLNPKDERPAIQKMAEHEEVTTVSELQSWFQKIEQQRDAILNMSPELSAWFGEQFTARAHL